MKYIILLMLLVLEVNAQRPLQVGDIIPESFWQQTHTLYANGKTTEQTLAAYKGKLLVLDFWATWCAPCVAALPKVDSLNQAFKGQLQILSVSYQNEKDLAPLAAKTPQLKTLINERLLHQLFPHVYLPHLVWLGADGKVLAITGQEAMSAGKLTAAMKGIAPDAPTKADTIIAFDKTKWLLAQQHPALKPQLEFSSTLTKHLPGFTAFSSFKQLDSAKGYRFVATNYTILGLLVFAHSDLGISNFSYVINEVKEPIKLIADRKTTDLKVWNKLHTYNFEFAASDQIAPKQADFFALIRKQLAFYFPAYRSELVLRKKKCWALTATGPLMGLVSKNNSSYFKKDASGYYLSNFSLKSLVKMLNMNTFQKSEIPLVDDTHFKEKISIDIVADMGNMVDINRALASYHLQFVLKEMEVPYLLVSDSTSP